MFKDLIIGQYLSGNSILHRLNPAFKIVLTILYALMLFMIKSPLGYLIYALYTFALIFAASVPIKMITKGIKPILWIVIITALLNLFMTQGETAVSFLGLKITHEGIRTAAEITIRLIFLVIATSFLTLTTPPLLLTDGIETLLSPLKKIKVPAHETAMMMTIAIRFIPTIASESEKIKKAQLARGADLETGNIIKRAKAMTPIFIPLFVNAFKRADELAEAMEARCYRGGENRTKMKETKMTLLDLKAGLIFLAAAAILFAAELLI